MSSKKVVFYILAAADLKARDLYASRLAEKAYQAGKKTYLHVSTLIEAETLDTQLWTFRDISFVPHEIYHNSKIDAVIYPVLIGYTDIVPSEYNDVLINLTDTIPKFYGDFQHIIEIVQNVPEAKQLARKKYKIYQQANLQMESHNL